jgi:outer membrane protein assembly factor BamB
MLIAGLSGPALGDDWPQWRGSNHDGVSFESGWKSEWDQEGPRQLWRAQVGTGFSSVAVSRGRVFTMGNEKDVDTVYCLDAETGRVIWKHSYDCALHPRFYEGGPGATPTVHGDRVYTFSKKGHVFCFEAATGNVLWSADIRQALDLKLPEWSFAGSPLIEGDLVILNAGTAGTALHKDTGELVWSSGSDAGGYATPVPVEIEGKRAVVIFGAKEIVLIEPATGRALWRHRWESERDVNAADPVIWGDRMFISSSTGSAVLKFSSTGASVVWEKKQFMRNYFNPAVLLDGHLYALDGTTHRPTELACVEFETGEKKWSEPGFGSGGWIAADGKLIVLDKGELIVVKADPAGFKPLARAQVIGGKCWTSPVLANGLVFCRNARGDLVCIDLRPAASTESQ